MLVIDPGFRGFPEDITKRAKSKEQRAVYLRYAAVGTHPGGHAHSAHTSFRAERSRQHSV